MKSVYDVLIVGAGPGGCAAALYCAQAGLDTLLLEKLSAGGQLGLTDRIDNYPGCPAVSGEDLARRMLQGAQAAGARLLLCQVTGAELSGDVKIVHTSTMDFFARTVILATGAEPKALGLPGEAEFRGRGLSYCAHCDGWRCRGGVAAVVGGGNTAAAEALYLSRIAKQVILIHRRDRLRAGAASIRALARAGNVTVRYDTQVTSLLGGRDLTGLLLRDGRTGAGETIPCDGLFVAIGRTPVTAFLGPEAPRTPEGYLAADETTCTSLPGVFAVGDVREKPLRQVVTAAADGAVAAHFAGVYLSSTEKR